MAVLHVTYYCSVNGVSHITTMWTSTYAIYAQHSPLLSAGWCTLAMHVYYKIEKHLNYSIIQCCLLSGRVKLKSKHASELFKLDVSGKHISGIIVGWYPYDVTHNFVLLIN